MSFASKLGMRTSSLCTRLLRALVGACPRRAVAQDLDDQTPSAARELATEDSAPYQQSDFENGFDRFDLGYQLGGDVTASGAGVLGPF